MAVMMQAFYWDAPVKEDKRGEWWDTIREKVPQLAASGFNSLWLPPISKAADPNSNGYDPYDYFDLGDIDQKGSMKTLYGNRAELENLIRTMREHNMGAIADMVINHNSGADEEETNPLNGQKMWTKFRPKSGKFPRDWNCFHPSRYERTMIEGENFAGFPHLCHRNPLVYTAMFEYARLLIEELDFEGLRFDFVKGYGAWMIGLLSKYQYQKKDGREFAPFVVGEYWSGPDDIGDWLDKVHAVTDQQVAAFDFPLRYKLKDMCDTPSYDLRKLTDEGSVSAARPFNAVTFVDNHDMQNNEIVNDKMLAYSFILTGDGYPCVFWWDYFNNELARPNTPNGIDALVSAHHKHAGGESSILHADPDLYVMQRAGTESQTGLVYVLNNLGNQWSGRAVKTKWPNKKFKPVAWDGYQAPQPEERTTDGEGSAEFPAPPRGYCVYAPVD
ncbi:alpha-amylase domain-containing protein [Terracidiphilus gabretensis]|uniref:alpha-amylase domain-containing protein n=1 Tax=Terracidiphilus gabretensis TaxID=1577687 RepID=UPI00071B290A|nr:alpha-amylase domain-containing protein [Terracidiphilus gabretensis]